MKVSELLSEEDKKKAARDKRAQRDHEEFLRKRNFSTSVDALKAKIEPRKTVTLGGHTPSVIVSSGKPHGKIR